MKKKLEEHEELVDALTVAELLGVYKGKLQELRNAGMPTRGLGKSMKYPWRECIKWYTDHIIKREVEKVRAQMPTGPEMDKDEAVARKLTAEALIKEVELEQLRGTLVNYRDAEAELAKHLGIVRQGLLSFPARVAPYLVGLTNEMDAREMMITKMNDLMQQLAKQVEEAETVVDEDIEDENDE